MTKTRKPRLLFIGNRTHSRRILHHVLKEGWDVVGAIGATGEFANTQSGFTPFDEVCSAFDIPLLETDDINASAVQSFIEGKDLHLGICGGWTQIISDDILTLPDLGIVGFHASPLPQGRGGAPVNWQMILGRESVGVSLFKMTSEVDNGPVYGQRHVPVEDRDDIATVYDRVTAASCNILDSALPDVARGEFEGTRQSASKATYFPQRKPADGIMDWHWDAEFLSNWICAQTHPYPGAFTFHDGHKLRIWEASILDDTSEGRSPGEVTSIVDGAGIDVATGTDILRLERVQQGDRPPEWGDDFAARTNVAVGTVLGSADSFPEWLYTGIRDGKGGFEYTTNLRVGETARLQPVCCSYPAPRTIQITTRLDETIIHEETVEVNGWTAVAVDYSLPDTGPSTLKIMFYENDEKVDQRQLKVYGKRPLNEPR